MGEDDPAAGQAGETEIRQRRQRRAVSAHLLERSERGLEARTVVRTHRGHAQLAQAVGRRPRADAGERLRVLVERQ